jgi:hypothetical protein
MPDRRGPDVGRRAGIGVTIDLDAAAALLGVVESKPGDQVQPFARLEVDLRIRAEEVAPVRALGGFVDRQAVRIRRVGAVRQHGVFEIVAALPAVAVEPVEAGGPGDFLARMQGEIGIEIGVGERERLAETVGIVGDAVGGEVRAQEAFRVAAVGMIERERRHPFA